MIPENEQMIWNIWKSKINCFILFLLSVIDCTVSEWGVWSECDVSCGTGMMSRTRTILNAPENGGKHCPSLVQKRGCQGFKCHGQRDRRVLRGLDYFFIHFHYQQRTNFHCTLPTICYFSMENVIHTQTFLMSFTLCRLWYTLKTETLSCRVHFKSQHYYEVNFIVHSKWGLVGWLAGNGIRWHESFWVLKNEFTSRSINVY